MKLYTVGYQGIDLATYIDALNDAGVNILIDVRETAWSYKREFCKNALKNALAEVGIRYIHVRSAGNPKENRRTAKSAVECLDRFRQHLTADSTGVSDLLAILTEAAKTNKTVCLTCFERDASQCHRSVLASALTEHVPFVRRVDLCPQSKQEIRSHRIPKTHNHKAARMHKKIPQKEA